MCVYSLPDHGKALLLFKTVLQAQVGGNAETGVLGEYSRLQQAEKGQYATAFFQVMIGLQC